MKRSTIKEEIKLKGPSFFTPLKKVIVTLEPSNSEGIYFEKKGNSNRYDLSNLYGHQAITGARYLKIKEGSYGIRVPEHLLSAIYLTGITDINIICNSGEIPVCGSGIAEFYQRLLENKVTKDVEVKSLRAMKKAEYRNTINDTETVITVEPNNDLEIKIKSAKHKDIISLNEKELILHDTIKEAPQHLKARPIARLQNPYIFLAWKLARKIGFKGITPENYIIASPSLNPVEIENQMDKQYRQKRNEHLAHTAVCDFPGELLSLGSDIQASFTLKNTNHISRVEAIRYFNSSNVFA